MTLLSQQPPAGEAFSVLSYFFSKGPRTMLQSFSLLLVVGVLFVFSGVKLNLQ